MTNNENRENEENLGQEIDELLDQGLGQKEIETMGYTPSLIRQRVRKRVKDGKGPAIPSGHNDTLALRKSGESVLPEWLGKDVVEIFDGAIRGRKIFMAGISVPLMGLRLFAEGVKPIIDLMATWQKGQAEAAQAAQQSGIEVAQTAGEAAAGGVAKFFMDTKPWQSASPNPMQSMMADTMRPIFQQMMGQVMGSFMRPSPQGQAGVQSPQPGQADFQQSGGVQQASEDEVKEAFND